MKKEVLENGVFLYVVALCNERTTVTHHAQVGLPKIFYRRFASIFQLDNNGSLPQLQKADECFKQRLSDKGSYFKDNIKASRGIFKFLEGIQLDEYFLVFGDQSPISFSAENMVIISNYLYELNGKSVRYKPNESLLESFHVVGYAQGDRKIYIGESDKTKRVCRFCGKTYKDTKYQKKAHAISEALGNNTIFCNEECDVCNERFGETLEMELYRQFGILYSLYGVKGKKGKRKYVDENISISDEGVQIKVNSEVPSKEELAQSGFSFNVDGGLSYTPQNVYKCLCKFAISVIDKKYLCELQKTIDWISSDEMLSKVPYVYIRNCYNENHPMIAIYTSKESNYPDRTFIARIFLLNIELVYIFPYRGDVLIENGTSDISDFLDLYWGQDKTTIESYSKSDYSRVDSIANQMAFKINPFTPETVENK